MNALALACFVIVLLSFFFSLFLFTRQRGTQIKGISNRWIAFGGLTVVLLVCFIFFMANYQTQNTVTNYVVNGVTIPVVTSTTDFPGNTYYTAIIFFTVITSLFYLIQVIRESTFFGVQREGHRQNSRSI